MSKREMPKFLSMQLIRESIQRYEAKIPTLKDEDMRKLFGSLNMTLAEVSYYQALKNKAMLANKIDLEFANFCFAQLNHWMMGISYNQRDLAIRVVLTQVFVWMKLNKC